MVNDILSAVSNLDYRLIKEATDLTANHVWLQDLVYFCAQLLIYLMFLPLYVLWRRPELRGKHHGAKKAVMIVLVGIVAALAVKEVVSFLYFRERPFLAHPDLLAMTFRVDPESFPSAHTMIAFTISTSLLLSGYRRLGWTLIFASILVALGRVFSGVHYPTDVIGGMVIGIGSAWYLHREASSLKAYLPDS
ncbi:phosphatase PAP2 family protein [Patescibacteria group bacterium]|nr:phosphatase PAP2 family protein [Patescibacteria group bacterium]